MDLDNPGPLSVASEGSQLNMDTQGYMGKDSEVTLRIPEYNVVSMYVLHHPYSLLNYHS